jgi:2-methylcitrate dehydratase
VDIFDVAYQMIGGGEEGNKEEAIETKEQADHSLPYLLAVVTFMAGPLHRWN